MIVLPWPLSINTYWRSVHGRNILSREGRRYRVPVLAALQAQPPRCWPADVQLSVSISVHPPDRRRRDLDNMLKTVLDLLTHGDVYGDDSQIDELRIVRGPVKAGGCVEVEVTAL